MIYLSLIRTLFQALPIKASFRKRPQRRAIHGTGWLRISASYSSRLKRTRGRLYQAMPFEVRAVFTRANALFNPHQFFFLCHTLTMPVAATARKHKQYVDITKIPPISRRYLFNNLVVQTVIVVIVNSFKRFFRT